MHLFVNICRLLIKRKVKMARYWPSSFLRVYGFSFRNLFSRRPIVLLLEKRSETLLAGWVLATLGNRLVFCLRINSMQWESFCGCLSCSLLETTSDRTVKFNKLVEWSILWNWKTWMRTLHTELKLYLLPLIIFFWQDEPKMSFT